MPDQHLFRCLRKAPQLLVDKQQNTDPKFCRGPWPDITIVALGLRSETGGISSHSKSQTTRNLVENEEPNLNVPSCGGITIDGK